MIELTTEKIEEGLFYKSSMFKTIEGSNIPVKTRALFNIKEYILENNKYKIAQPITFTPYASAKSCSARCAFCSENLFLKGKNTPGQSLRPPADYHEKLSIMLRKLKTVPLGLSLSGLEISDDQEWLLKTLKVLSDWENSGGVWTEKAVYTNGAGFGGESGGKIIQALKQMDIDRVEVSRHHFNGLENQKIMRFRDGYNVKENEVFEKNVFQMLAFGMPLNLVCILQKNGVDSNEKISEYLEWSRKLGIKKIIFRELCEVPTIYRENSTFKYIENNRFQIEPLVKDWISENRNISHFVNGYYFWNAVFEYKNQQVVFERSDYSEMKKRHCSDVIYKFIYFANGNLCYDWDPGKIIMESKDVS